MTLVEYNTVGSGIFGFTSLAKLDNFLAGRYLSLEDNIFVENVVSDIQYFLSRGEVFHKSVLIFPPVNNYRRFLIHRICEEITFKELSTFSVGQGLSRRTVVCVKSLIRESFTFNHPHDQSFKNIEDQPLSTMVVERQPISSENSPEHHPDNDHTKRARSTPAIYRPPAVRKLEALRMKQNVEVTPIQTKPTPPKTEKTCTRQRRPDLQVYVPRAKRASMMDQTISESSEQKSSIRCQVSSDVKKEMPNVSTSVCSPVSACTDKTNHISPQSSSKSDGETKLSSKEVDINCGVSGEKHLNSSSVKCNLLVVEEDSVKSSVPCNENDGNNIFNGDSCVISILNNTECAKVITSESSILYSTTSGIFNTGDIDNSSVNNIENKDHKVVLKDSSVLLSNGESKKCKDISKENNLKHFESDSEQLKKNVCTMMNSEFLPNCLNFEPKNVGDQEPSVESSFGKEISNSEASVSDVPIISDPEIPVDLSSKPEVSNIEEKASNGNARNKRCKNSSKLSSSLDEKSKNSIVSASPSLAPSNTLPVSLNPDECTWDMLFDDNGDCLDPKIMEELTNAVGCVTIEKPQSDYNRFLSNKEINLPGGDDEYAHVLEIYDFPAEFKTQDLLAIFAAYKNGGFEVKWVDDTHALGVFSSSRVAADVLAYNHPLVKTRPLSEATPESRLKARRSAEFLQPYRARPETCVALARRLVTGALGMKISTSREEREAERRLLKEAREKRRLAARQQNDAWEGTIR